MTEYSLKGYDSVGGAITVRYPLQWPSFYISSTCLPFSNEAGMFSSSTHQAAKRLTITHTSEKESIVGERRKKKLSLFASCAKYRKCLKTISSEAKKPAIFRPLLNIAQYVFFTSTQSTCCGKPCWFWRVLRYAWFFYWRKMLRWRNSATPKRSPGSYILLGSSCIQNLC